MENIRYVNNVIVRTVLFDVCDQGLNTDWFSSFTIEKQSWIEHDMKNQPDTGVEDKNNKNLWQFSVSKYVLKVNKKLASELNYL